MVVKHPAHRPVDEMDSESLNHLPKVTVSEGANTHIWIPVLSTTLAASKQKYFSKSQLVYKKANNNK